MRRGLLLSLGSVVAPLLLIALLALWLARSDSGRDWLLARVINALPPGATLDWKQIDGSMTGPLELRGVVYRDEGVELRVDRLRIDHSFWPLLSGRMDIRTLELQRAELILPPDDQPFEMPRWPDVLPALKMPVTIAVQNLRVRDLRVRRQSEPLLHITRLDGAITLGDGELRLRRMVGSSDRGRFRLGGDYLPRENFRSTLGGRIDLPAMQGQPAAHLSVSVRGDLDDLQVAVGGQAGAPLSLRLRLREGRGRPQWQLRASTERLLPSRLGLADAAAYRFGLTATGAAGKAMLQGTLARDDVALTLDPSQVEVDGRVLRLTPLALSLPAGPLLLTGTVTLGKPAPEFDLHLRSPGLSLRGEGDSATPVVSASGEARAFGRLEAWKLEGKALLRRDGKQANVSLTGQGDARHLQLTTLQATTPDGRLNGSGELRWDPALGGTLAGKLTGFDPGYFFPDFPGALSGNFKLKARQAEGQWEGDAELANLRGQLRKRPVQGDARLKFAAGAGEGEVDLRIGDSRIEAGGRFGAQLDLTVRLSPLHLADLWPGSAGTLRGEVEVKGPRAAPAYRANLQGSQLRWEALQAAQLSAVGELPGSGRNGTLRLAAQRFGFSGETFDSARLTLAGSVAAFQADAELDGPSGRFAARATASGQGDRWQGRLEQFQLAPRRGDPWQLRAPVAYSYLGGSLELQPACLLTASPGARVCVAVSGTRASIDGQGLPLALLRPWLPETALDMEPFGLVQIDGNFRRAADGDWSGSAQLRSADGGLRIDPQRPRDLLRYSQLRLDAQLDAAGLQLTLDAGLAEGGRISGRARTGIGVDAPLQGALSLDVHELSWLELLSTDLAAPTGRVLGTLAFAGSRDAPSVSGEARLSGFAAELPALGVKLRNGDFVLRGEPGGQARINGQVTSGSGQLRVEGSLNLLDRRSPLLLTLRGEDILVANTPELMASMSPDLTLSYLDGLLELRGTVRVPSASIDLEGLDDSVSPSPDVVVLDPRNPSARTALRIDTDVDLRLGDEVRLRGFGLDGTLGGSVRVRDRPGRGTRLNGTLEVAGTYVAYGRPLQIKRGRLSFLNAAYDNPTLDILAEREFEQATVGVRVRGSALAPETTVVSSPAMATAEAVSWLLIGRPLSTASGNETQRISASALALSAGSNLLAQRIGTRLGLDSAGISDTRALGGSTLELGKQISPRLFVSYGLSLIGTGQVLTLKYLLNRGLNVSVESGSRESAASINWRKEK